MSSTPIFSLPRMKRLRSVEAFTGKRVELVVDPFRNGADSSSSYFGRILTVALPKTGSQSDLVVLDEEGTTSLPLAFSLATVRAVRPIEEASP